MAEDENRPTTHRRPAVGIRIEDTVAITDTGHEVLSLGVPRTVAEIEALMKKDGILQILKKYGV